MTPSYSSDCAEDSFSNQLVILNDEVNDKSSTEESKSERFAFLDNYLKKLVEIGTTLVDFRLKSQSESLDTSVKSDSTPKVNKPESTFKFNKNKRDEDLSLNENNIKKPPNQGIIKKQYASTLTKKLLLNDEFLNRLYLSSEIERENALNDMFDNMVMNNFIVEYSKEGHIKESNDKKFKPKGIEIRSQDRLETQYKNRKRNNLIKENLKNSNLNPTPRLVYVDSLMEREKSHGDINVVDSANEIDSRISRILIGTEIEYQLNDVIDKSIVKLLAIPRKIITKENDITIDYDKISDVFEASIKSVLPFKKSEKFIKKKLRKIENQLNEVKSLFKFPNNLSLEYVSEFERKAKVNDDNDMKNYCEVSLENKDLKGLGIVKNINSTNVTNGIDLIIPFPERSSTLVNEINSNPFSMVSSDEKTPPTISIDYSPPESEIRIEMVRPENSLDKKQLSSKRKEFDSTNRKLSNENVSLYQIDIKGKKCIFKESDLLMLDSCHFGFLDDKPIEIQVNSCYDKTIKSMLINGGKSSKEEIFLENIERNLESDCQKNIYGKAIELSQQLLDAIDIESKKNKLELELTKILKRESFIEVSLSNTPMNIARPLSNSKEKKNVNVFECEILKNERKPSESYSSEFNENLLATSLIDQHEEHILSTSKLHERLPQPSISNENKSLNNNKVENICQKIPLRVKSKNSYEEDEIINKREFYIEDGECEGERYIPRNTLQFTVEIESVFDANFSNHTKAFCNNIFKKSSLSEERKMTEKSFKSNISIQSSFDKSSTASIESEKEK